jgi:hypothetical protein
MLRPKRRCGYQYHGRWRVGNKDPGHQKIKTQSNVQGLVSNWGRMFNESWGLWRGQGLGSFPFEKGDVGAVVKESTESILRGDGTGPNEIVPEDVLEVGLTRLTEEMSRGE